uniref:Uncharacterized protein n=1 Tax=viral metagenome TaxID=1070528 RepID=A0A6C0I6G8_9ZZZZ
MAPLGHSQVLQPNLSGGANPSGAHYPNPMFSSRVEAVGGCGGQNPGYNIVAKPQMSGGNNMYRRGGSKRRRHGKSKKHFSKRRHCKKCHCKKCHCKRRQRSMRAGGLSALSPSSVSGGANDSYGQYGNQSYFGVGSKTGFAPNLIGMANPPPINAHKCS